MSGGHKTINHIHTVLLMVILTDQGVTNYQVVATDLTEEEIQSIYLKILDGEKITIRDTITEEFSQVLKNNFIETAKLHIGKKSINFHIERHGVKLL